MITSVLACLVCMGLGHRVPNPWVERSDSPLMVNGDLLQPTPFRGSLSQKSTVGRRASPNSLEALSSLLQAFSGARASVLPMGRHNLQRSVAHRAVVAPTMNVAPSGPERADELRKALSEALRHEQYTTAARLRDELAGLRDELADLEMHDEDAVLQANIAFYDAFSMRDIEAMSELWAQDHGVVCAHPGQLILKGYENILESFDEIFEGGGPDISMSNVQIKLMNGGKSAFVTCIEVVRGDPGTLATNIFEKGNDGRWRMVHHQAAPLVREVAHMLN